MASPPTFPVLSDCWIGCVQIYSYLKLTIYFLCVYSVYLYGLSPFGPQNFSYSGVPDWVPVECFLFWVSSSSPSRSNFGGYFHCLFVFPFSNFQSSTFNFQFSINLYFAYICIDYGFPLQYYIYTLSI